MAEGNVEIVRRLFEAQDEGLARGELTAAFATGLLADDVEWVMPEGVPNPGVYRGREEYDRFVHRWSEDFDGWRVHIEDLREAPGGRVLAVIRHTGVGRASGVPVELRHAQIWEVENGLVTRIENFFEVGDAREAAGLSRG